MEIQGLTGIHQGRRIAVNGTLVIGRNQQSCAVVYPDNTKGISRVHCKIDQTPSGLTVTDLGSSYGTFVNGRKLPPNVPTPVREGDTFYLGNQNNSFSIVGGTSPSENAGRSKPSGGLSTGAIIGIVVAVLVVAAIIGFIVFKGLNSKEISLIGSTWKVAEAPGMRMSFAENGDLIITNQGEFEINGSFTYSPAGDGMISVKYSAPSDEVGVGTNDSIFSIIGGGRSKLETVSNEYKAGYVWKYEYNKKTDSVKISDVNGYKLFTLEH